jgi:hypothetical protein
MLNKKSSDLISFFMENPCLYTNTKPNIKTTKHTRKIFEYLLEQLTRSDKYVRKLRGNLNPSISQIREISDIPKSAIFSHGSMPIKVEEYIHTHSVFCIKYQFAMFHRKIFIYFIATNHNDNNLNVYTEYVERIIMWLYILHIQSSEKCSEQLKIFIYFTEMDKWLPRPTHKLHILDQSNINTAYTYSCRKNNEIVIYRKEEWFKVFIHETFHSFGLDFSSNSDSVLTKEKILQLFNVNSDVNLFEAYTELWARIMNAVFTSYYLTIGTKRIGNIYINNKSLFIDKCEILIYLEKIYSCFQMVKVLDYMSVNYEDIIHMDHHSSISIKLKYREKTNVLAYYVITNILIFYYQDFFLWLNKNNTNNSLFQSKQEVSYQLKLCAFIQSHYNMPDFIASIRCSEKTLTQLNNKQFNLRNNLRMTLCELE